MFKPITTITTLTALAIALPGCGGTEQASSSAGGSAAPEKKQEALELGQHAVSPFVDYGTSRDSESTKVGVRVTAIRKGRVADLRQFNLSRAQRRSVPYYVDAKFENLGRFALSRNLLRVSMEDADGREYRPATLVLLGGTFRKCPETPRGPLRPRQSFASCSAILLPKGTEPGRVRFQGDVAEDPLFWELRS
ncbi:MAG TPA: hypothetical protein VF533_16175 [Solirubrobacteraceae bacterium]|jgi:hypothetical protein